MNQPARCALSLLIPAVFLIAACSPAPAATQDSALVQQLIEQSVALTVAAHSAQATEQQVLLPTPSPIPTSEIVELPNAPEATAESVELPSPPQATSESVEPTNVADSTDSEDESEVSCVVTSDPSLPQSQLKVGDAATINRALNLRTRPSLLNRIVLVHQPGSQVEIIGGPTETRYQNGSKYVWWQVRLPGGLIGWSAEFSECGRFYFMEPVK